MAVDVITSNGYRSVMRNVPPKVFSKMRMADKILLLSYDADRPTNAACQSICESVV